MVGRNGSQRVWLWLPSRGAVSSPGASSSRLAFPTALRSGNGRIEATEIDIATKTAGRIKEILVNDGDVVEAGQVVARMDTQTLEAELRQAQAQVRQAQQAKATATAIVAQRESAKATAAAVVAQRESAKVTAAAVVAQRESELALAEKELTRSQQLAFKGAGSQQQLDTDYTRYKSTTAALSAAQSQLLEAQSAIAAAKSQAAEAQSAMEVAKSQVVEAQSSYRSSSRHDRAAEGRDRGQHPQGTAQRTCAIPHGTAR